MEICRAIIEWIAEIIEYCSNTYPQGRGMVRLRELAIKFGRISDEEVANQIEAHHELDFDIILVPKIYCHFTETGRDYLVMEYVEGYTREVDKIRDLVPADPQICPDYMFEIQEEGEIMALVPPLRLAFEIPK